MVIRSPFSDVDIPNKPLTEVVLARAGEFSAAPALIDAPSGRTITYAQLRDSVRAVAAGLDERGFRKGEVFAHYAPNCPEYVVTFHAVATLGAINTTANPLLTPEELAQQLSDCGDVCWSPCRNGSRPRRLRPTRQAWRRSSSTAKPAPPPSLRRCAQLASRPRS